MGAEQTTTESFNADGTNQTNLVFDYSYDDDSNICWNRLDTYSGQYGTTGQSLNWNTCNHSDAVLRMTFPDSYISSAGFNLGAADFTWYVTWNYSDGTSSSKTSYDAHFASYEAVSHTAPTNKYIESVDVETDDYVLVDDISWTYDTVTAGIGDPSNLTTSVNLHTGAITIDWDAATGYEYSAERYAIGFDKADPPMYGIATGNVGDSTALNTEYTFTKSYLESALSATVGDTIYFKVRADNDTNSQYSNWTTLASYTIQDVASGVTNLTISNTEYQGLDFSWTQPNTGWSAVESYRIEYKLSSEETYTGIDIANASATSYTIEDISAGTYDFVVYSCTDSGSYCHGGQAGPVTNYEVLSTTATTTTTTTTTTTIYVAPEPPPPPPPPTTLAPVVVVMDDGSEAEYTQDQIKQGDVERDNERKSNEDKWGCYVTNVALERGDCEEYNIALYNSTTTTTIPEIIEEEVIEEEIIDDKIVETEDILDDKDIEKDEIKDDELLPDDEIPILDDEIFIEEEILDDSEDIITDGDLVEDIVEEPIKEEVLEEEPIVEDIVEDIPSVEETIIEVMEVIEIPEQDNTETAPKINVSTLTEVQKEVVQQQVTKVAKAEDVKNMSKEEKTVAAAALGVQEEELEIVAELSENDESVSQAVEEFVERASEVPEGNEYTLADAITEVQVEAFLENPLQELTDISIEEFAENLANVSEIGNDMTTDQKEKAQEVVVPVIIASQIIAQAGSLMRRF